MAVASQQVTVTTTATLLSIAPADNAPGSSAMLRNIGTAVVYLGGSNLVAGLIPATPTANGYPLYAGESVAADLITTALAGNPFTGTHTVDEQIYGITDSGNTGYIAVLGVNV